MKIFLTLELADDTKLPTHCPDINELVKKLTADLAHSALVNTVAHDAPRVTPSFYPPTCSRCAAPLLPSGACSSPNCPVGRQPERKPSARRLAATVPGVRLGSTLNRR